MEVPANPYSPPVTSLPAGPHLARVGIRFGWVFASPFVLLAVLAMFDSVDRNFHPVNFTAPAALLVLGAINCLCGWWWAVKVRRGLRWFLVSAAAMGLAISALLIAVSVGGFSLSRGDLVMLTPGEAVDVFSVVTPFVTAWLVLMGAMVRWRVRVLERRARGGTAPGGDTSAATSGPAPVSPDA